MHKKRFIKLAMSRGKSRNEALQLAEKVDAYGNYEEMFCYLENPLAGITVEFPKAVTEKLKRLEESTKEAEKGLKSLFDALKEWR